MDHFIYYLLVGCVIAIASAISLAIVVGAMFTLYNRIHIKKMHDIESTLSKHEQEKAARAPAKLIEPPPASQRRNDDAMYSQQELHAPGSSGKIAAASPSPVHKNTISASSSSQKLVVNLPDIPTPLASAVTRRTSYTSDSPHIIQQPSPTNTTPRSGSGRDRQTPTSFVQQNNTTSSPQKPSPVDVAATIRQNLANKPKAQPPKTLQRVKRFRPSLGGST